MSAQLRVFNCAYSTVVAQVRLDTNDWVLTVNRRVSARLWPYVTIEIYDDACTWAPVELATSQLVMEDL